MKYDFFSHFWNYINALDHHAVFSLISIVVMARPIKLFPATERVYQLLGIETSQAILRDRVSLKWFLYLMFSANLFFFAVSVFHVWCKICCERGDAFYQLETQRTVIFHVVAFFGEVPSICLLTSPTCLEDRRKTKFQLPFFWIVKEFSKS